MQKKDQSPLESKSLAAQYLMIRQACLYFSKDYQIHK